MLPPVVSSVVPWICTKAPSDAASARLRATGGTCEALGGPAVGESGSLLVHRALHSPGSLVRTATGSRPLEFMGAQGRIPRHSGPVPSDRRVDRRLVNCP